MLKNMIMKPAFELKNISFAFDKNQLFSNLSLTLPSGSICAILGPNGTGKTTLLHLLLGWLTPEQGKIFLFGEELKNYSPRKRGQTLSLLPQKENLSFGYSVMEYILLGRAPYLKTLQQPGNIDKKIASEALETVGGSTLSNRKIPNLSGGETQVCLMARSLTQEPEILLLDEPTNHLDLARKREMINLIKSYKTQQKTVIFTTHDPEIAARVADYLVLAGKDGMVESGPFDKLFNADKLTALYDIPVKIVKLDDGTVTVVY